MTNADLLREYSWALILVVMVIYAALSILRRWLVSRRKIEFGEDSISTDPEARAKRMRYLSFFAIMGIIGFTAVAIMNSF